MNDKAFFDTNVILYAFSQDVPRGQVAETLLAAGGELSVQVLNEFVAVARRKLGKSWEDVRRALDLLRVFCPDPVPLTMDTHNRAVQIAERFGYSIFDSLIIAAALDAGASILYSEDMRDSQEVDGLTIRNPFPAGHPVRTG
jgi:predicted nucleic acid-binding protein